MKQPTLQDQYNLIQEGKGNKEIFLKAAKKSYPDLIRNSAGFDEAANILKKRSVISENLLGIGLVSQNNTQPDWFSIFNDKMESLQEEAKVEEKKPTKEVVDLETQGYDYKDKSNSNNNPGFFQGFYTEMKDPKNCEKSVEEITEIVSKNLAKDPLFYVKNGQFGVKGIGYTDDVPGLGMSKEPQGKYKSSGYGDIKESLTEAKKKNQIQDYIKEVEKRGSMAALEAKMSALDEAIEERKQKLSSIEENEDIAEFINQSSLKEIQREIKELEKAKEKYAKLHEKMVGKEKPKKEVIDEDPLEENMFQPMSKNYVSREKVKNMSQDAGILEPDAQSALEDLISVFGDDVPREEVIEVLKIYKLMDNFPEFKDVQSSELPDFSLNETKLRKAIRNIIRETLSK